MPEGSEKVEANRMVDSTDISIRIVDPTDTSMRKVDVFPGPPPRPSEISPLEAAATTAKNPTSSAPAAQADTGTPTGASSGT